MRVGSRGPASAHTPGKRKVLIVDDHPIVRQGLRLMIDNGVVESAVRFHVADPAALGASEAVQRAKLVDHRSGQVGGGHVDEAATESGEVGIADLGPDHHAALDRRVAGRTQGRRVTGMEAAGDVGAGDQLQHGVIVTQTPPAV